MFGSVNFVQIIFIPLFGKYLQILKAHRLFVIGLFVCGVANIGFGCLELADERVPFLTLSFVIRIISAIGEAAFLTSLYPLATKVSSKYSYRPIKCIKINKYIREEHMLVMSKTYFKFVDV